MKVSFFSTFIVVIIWFSAGMVVGHIIYSEGAKTRADFQTKFNQLRHEVNIQLKVAQAEEENTRDIAERNRCEINDMQYVTEEPMEPTCRGCHI